MRVTISAGNLYPDGTSESATTLIVDESDPLAIGQAILAVTQQAANDPTEPDALDMTLTWSA